jgi:hypothetical protein
MILLLLSGILVVFSGLLFSLSFSIQGLNRAIINTPIEMMYRTVAFDNSEMKFEKEKFEENIMSYYDSTIVRYSKSYEVDFYYYELEDGSMCLSDYCSGVEITVNCKLMMDYTFRRVMYYELRG